MKLSYSMGKIFTYSPRIPAEAELKKFDPSERNNRPLAKTRKVLIWLTLIIIILIFIAVYYFSILDYIF
jgi:hypothetical protein